MFASHSCARSNKVNLLGLIDTTNVRRFFSSTLQSSSTTLVCFLDSEHPRPSHDTKMANPRKFSEKIALHNQKQAEETAAFEEIMREVMGATRVFYVILCPQHSNVSLFTLDNNVDWQSKSLSLITSNSSSQSQLNSAHQLMAIMTATNGSFSQSHLAFCPIRVLITFSVSCNDRNNCSSQC